MNRKVKFLSKLVWCSLKFCWHEYHGCNSVWKHFPRVVASTCSINTKIFKTTHNWFKINQFSSYKELSSMYLFTYSPGYLSYLNCLRLMLNCCILRRNLLGNLHIEKIVVLATSKLIFIMVFIFWEQS